MKKVKFKHLDGENKLTAVSQMFHLAKQYDWPNGKVWKIEEDVLADLKQDYNPDDHFSFYLNDFDEVETKIG